MNASLTQFFPFSLIPHKSNYACGSIYYVKKVTKAILPVAGLGTRFLPATKAIPKEILPLVDRPLIQYAIDEAREAGITDFIFVTSRGKTALEDYFDHAPMLEADLEAKGKTALLDTLRSTNMESGSIAYVRQHRAMGLGHAVACASKLIDLARRMGIATVPALNAEVGTPDIPLDRIVDTDINEKIAAIYARDYQSFGFSDWRA